MGFGCFAVLLLLTIISARSAVLPDDRRRQPKSQFLRIHNRGLRQVITATTCSSVRSPQDYPATLDVRYLYLVEYYGSLELNSLAKAIATSVASSLNSCDDNDQPNFAVELTEENEHQILTTGL